MAVSNAPPDWRSAWGGAAPATPGSQPAAPPAIATPFPAASELEHNGSLIYRSPAALGGSGFVNLGDALRMDVTRQWVYAHWARKSTGLADPELFGVRAPLVTGSRMTDLAGAISYYFDAAGVVQKLRFHGRTADTSQVIALAQQRFGLSRQEGRPGEQLYQRRSRGRVESELRTRPEAVLWGASPHSSFIVDLEINRPGTGRRVEPIAARLDLPPAAPAEPTPPPPAATPPRPAEATTADEAPPARRLQPGRLPWTRWPE